MGGRRKRRWLRNTGLAVLFTVLAAVAVFGVFQVGQLALERAPKSTDPQQVSVPEPEGSEPALVSFGPVEEASRDASAANAQKTTPDSLPEVSAPEPEPAGLFQNYWDAAAERAAQMTLEEKVGQVFFFRCPAEGAVEAVSTYHPGGYVLFGRDFEGKSAEEVRRTIESYQQASGIPLAIAVDEEGGTVVRVSSNPQLAPERYRSPQDVYAAGGMNGVYNDTVEKSELLLSLGINLNLAPVADVSTNPGDYMYARTFGQDAEATAGYVRIVTGAMNSAGLSGVLKHFPGYGNNSDTHTGIALDDRPLSAFTDGDFLPFSAGIQQGAPCVLVSHNIVSCLDAEHPASLSPEVHQVLREDLGFTGIMMTDDLAMDAITEYTGGTDPCVAAFLAGNDVLLASDIPQSCAALLAAVQDGTISETDLEERVTRILAWKYAYGIL